LGRNSMPPTLRGLASGKEVLAVHGTAVTPARA
jgi:hypothetical protein